MAETATQVQETQETQETTQPDVSTMLQQHFWEDKPITKPTEEQKAEEVKPEEQKVEQPQVNEWWKDYEWDSAETAKNEIARLKQVKPQEEFKFANDASKQFYDYFKEGKLDEAHSMWQKQKDLEKLTSGDVTDDNAVSIIKASLKNRYTEFSDADVDRKFNKMYGLPKEPTQKVDELDDEFKQRHDEWKEQVHEIRADILLEAKTVKPELLKLKSELVLPDISKSNQETKREPSQEELAAFQKHKESFLQATDLFLKDFNGFSAQVKNEDVDYNVSYGTSQEEKSLVTNLLREFTESGFDANSLFIKDWVNQDGSLNVKQIIEDKMLLTNRDKILSKIANEAANQRLEIYLKGKKNININEVNNNGKNFGEVEKKTPSEQLQEKFWGN